MKIAITAITIGAFVFGALYLTLNGLSDSVADYVTKSGGGTN